MAVFASGVPLSSDRISIPQGTSDPSNPGTAQIYFNTTSNKIRIYNGTTWRDL